MEAAAQESEDKLRRTMEEKANEQYRLREQYQSKQSEERKQILAAKNSELERTQQQADRERERARKAEQVAEAAIKAGDEEKRTAEDEARRAVERANKAKGVRAFSLTTALLNSRDGQDRLCLFPMLPRRSFCRVGMNAF
jgi:dTMP kinase